MTKAPIRTQPSSGASTVVGVLFVLLGMFTYLVAPVLARADEPTPSDTGLVLMVVLEDRVLALDETGPSEPSGNEPVVPASAGTWQLVRLDTSQLSQDQAGDPYVSWSIDVAEGLQAMIGPAEDTAALNPVESEPVEAPVGSTMSLLVNADEPGSYRLPVEVTVALDGGESLTAARRVELEITEAEEADEAVIPDGGEDALENEPAETESGEDGDTGMPGGEDSDHEDTPATEDTGVEDPAGGDDPGDSRQPEDPGPGEDGEEPAPTTDVTDSRSQVEEGGPDAETNEPSGQDRQGVPSEAQRYETQDREEDTRVVGSNDSESLSLLAASDGHPEIEPGSVDLTDVHIDIGARIIDGELYQLVKDGTNATSPVWREPSDVRFHALEPSEIEIPESSSFSFLGPAGEQSWVLPQVQQAGLLWPGWNTEAIDDGVINRNVTWRLTGVDGPGRFAIFLTDSFGSPKVIFNSADGLPDSLSIPTGVHAHGNWAFSAPGTYRLSFEMSADLADGGTVSDSEVVTFEVHGSLDQPDEPDENDETDGDADDSVSNEDGSDDSDDDSLPHTGLEHAGLLSVVGGGLIFSGLGLVVGPRKRRSTE